LLSRWAEGPEREHHKVRLAAPGGDDVILCQITSQQIRDRYAIGIAETDFTEGTLRKPSNIRPNRLFSASTNLILYRAGHLNDPVVTSVIDRIVEILPAE
jgi:mRNA interferase MazF